MAPLQRRLTVGTPGPIKTEEPSRGSALVRPNGAGNLVGHLAPGAALRPQACSAAASCLSLAKRRRAARLRLVGGDQTIPIVRWVRLLDPSATVHPFWGPSCDREVRSTMARIVRV